MPQFAANLTMLFTETPFLDRFEKAHNSGFKVVEFLFPYPFAATEIKNKLDDAYVRKDEALPIQTDHELRIRKLELWGAMAIGGAYVVEFVFQFFAMPIHLSLHFISLALHLIHLSLHFISLAVTLLQLPFDFVEVVYSLVSGPSCCTLIEGK
jgi:hypothetical protein